MSYKTSRFFCGSVIGGLLFSGGCSREKLDEDQISGTVEQESRSLSEDYYQISVREPLEFASKRGFEWNPRHVGDSLEIRFYRHSFDLGELDKKIRPGTKITLMATRVKGANGYEFQAYGIDKIE